MERMHLLITVGLLVLLYFLMKGQQRWYGQSLETEKEVEEITKKREKIKVKSKEKKVLREKFVTAYIIVGAIWVPFHILFMHRSLQQEHIQTWLADYATLGIALSLGFMFMHGFLKQMGTLAIRGKQKSETGRRTKKFEMLLGSHHPLEPALIRNSLKLWEEEQPERIVWAKDAAKTVKTKSGDEYYDLDWESPEGRRRTLIHKDRATFMEKLSKVDVNQIKEEVDMILQQRLGLDASIAKLPADALEVRMKSLNFRAKDAEMFRYLIQGINEHSGFYKNLLEETLAADEHLTDSILEPIKTKSQEKIREVFTWVLTERLGIPENQVQHLLNNGINLPSEFPSISRTVKEGIFFGGYHAEFARVYQYDTEYTIIMAPDRFFETFSFTDRDWIDASYMPFPLPYTDFDWRLIDTIIIQIAPKEFEACNIIMPIYTDKDLKLLPGMIPPHPIDQVTKHEVSIFFIEESADDLLDKLIEKETALQRKERFEKEDLKLLEKLMRRLWMKIRNMRLQSVRANWQLLVAFVFIGMFIMFLLFQTGVFGEVVKNGGQTTTTA